MAGLLRAVRVQVFLTRRVRPVGIVTASWSLGSAAAGSGVSPTRAAPWSAPRGAWARSAAQLVSAHPVVGSDREAPDRVSHSARGVT